MYVGKQKYFPDLSAVDIPFSFFFHFFVCFVFVFVFVFCFFAKNSFRKFTDFLFYKITDIF